MVFSLCGGGCTVFHAVEFPVLGGGRRIFGREPGVLICVFCCCVCFSVLLLISDAVASLFFVLASM